MEEKSGSLNSRYEIGEKIGNGKFGNVYKGVNKKTGEKVAIKCEDKNMLVKILKHETTILNYLYRNGCKYVPVIYWYGMVKLDSYLVMPLYDSLLTSNQKFTEPIVNHLMIKMISILKHVHENYVIHRDIKPQNVMEKNGEIYLIDFGLSTVYVDEEKKHIANSGSREHIIGTPNYISLNVHHGVEPSRRDDLLSLGYIYLFFLNGGLSWEKKHYSLSGSHEMFPKTHVFNEENQTKQNIKKEYHKKESLTKIDRYFNSCHQLKYEETPDYACLIEFFI
jgi:serine/threonine protein kinase